MVLLNQADVFGTIVWFVIFFIFIALYPRLMLSQLIWQLEQSARKLEEMSSRANTMAARKASRTITKELRKRVDDFTDFFAIDPSNLDPYGIVNKVDQLIRQAETRFHEFTDEIATGKNETEKRELNYTLRAAIGLRQLAKIVRHFVELSKKFKNLQIAMIIKMQMPIIEKLAESEFKGAEAFIHGWPVGDSIGPLVAASLIESAKPIAEDVVVGTVNIEGRKCFVLKAKGPEPNLGRIDEAIVKLMKSHNIARFITIDAAGKLEGEKSGTVSEGIGFAMGGIGQREIIENILLPRKKPIDAIAVKVGMEEAISPMTKDIFGSLANVQLAVQRGVKRAPKGSRVLIIGVGNTCGVGDGKKHVQQVKEIVEKLAKKQEQEKKGKKA